MQIIKKTAEVYELRNGFEWGHIAIIQTGPESVDVVINSDYGSYAYFWTHCGKDPKKFLCKIDMHYAMNKFTNGKMYEPDPDKYSDQIKRTIINLRRDGDLNEQDARDAWDELLEIVEEYHKGDILFHKLVYSDWFEKVFKDYDGLPNAKRIKSEVSGFWEKIWIPFIDELKNE
jgi:hypothetical protein